MPHAANKMPIVLRDMARLLCGSRALGRKAGAGDRTDRCPNCLCMGRFPRCETPERDSYIRIRFFPLFDRSDSICAKSARGTEKQLMACKSKCSDITTHDIAPRDNILSSGF